MVPDADAVLGSRSGDEGELTPGQARYGLLLNEMGIVVDDGIVARWVRSFTG